MKRGNTELIKSRAFALRRNGATLSEISNELKVSKASLSGWFKGAHFSREEQLLITQKAMQKRKSGVQKSVLTNRMRVALLGQKNASSANKEFDSFKKQHLFIAGLTLYWAQGAQSNGGFHYASSDPEKVRLMLAWATNYLRVSKSDLTYRVFASPSAANSSSLTYWAGMLGLKETVFKPLVVQKIRKNEGGNVKNMANNKGSMRISYNSAELLRKILVWQKRLVRYYQET
jgi:hypothetical protein